MSALVPKLCERLIDIYNQFDENDELVEAILRDDAEELLIAIGMALAYSEGAITINKIGENHLKAAVIRLNEIAQEFEDGDE
jgi:hypothetical protein